MQDQKRARSKCGCACLSIYKPYFDPFYTAFCTALTPIVDTSSLGLAKTEDGTTASPHSVKADEATADDTTIAVRDKGGAVDGMYLRMSGKDVEEGGR